MLCCYSIGERFYQFNLDGYSHKNIGIVETYVREMNGNNENNGSLHKMTDKFRTILKAPECECVIIIY